MDLRLPWLCLNAWLAVSTMLLLAQTWRGAGAARSFLLTNTLGPKTRGFLLATLVVVAVAAAGATLVMSLRQRAQLTERWARRLSPLAVAFAIPALFQRALWTGDELGFLLYAALVGLCLEQLLRVSLTSFATADGPDARWLSLVGSARLQRAAPWCVAALVVGYFVVIGRHVVLNHWRMGTMSSDLAEFDNLFFNALHGHPFRAPAIDADLRDWGAFKVHAELILYLLLPVYALVPGPETLLLLQTAAVALTAWPVYGFAARRLGAWGGAVVAALYLMLPAVQRPNFYDFHFTPFGMLFVTLALYVHDLGQVRTDRLTRVLGFVLFGLALLCREDTAAGLSLAMLILAVLGVRPKTSAVLALIGFAYVAAVKLWLMPSIGAMWFDTIYDRLKAPGYKGLPAVLATLATNPIYALRALMTERKLLYVLHFSVPLLFLWMRRPWLLVAALPGAFFTLFVTDRPAMSESSFQYTYLWVPYVMVASVLGLESLRSAHDEDGGGAFSARRSAALLSALLVGASCCWNLGALFGGESIRGGSQTLPLSIADADWTRLRQLRALVATIPRAASVAATEREGPHVSTRLTMYSLKHDLGHDPDYLLLGDVAVRLETQHVTEAINSGKYGLEKRSGPFLLLKRGAPVADRPALLRKALKPGRT